MYRCVLLLFLTSQAFPQFTYKAVNVSGATSTQVRGINSAGEMVGFYRTTSLFSCTDYTLQVPNCAVHGFKVVGGTLTKVMVPNSVSTAITGVNDYGDFVGFYQKLDGTYHGFLWLHTNIIKTLNYPNTSLSTVPIGVNNSLVVVGGLWSINSVGTFANGGFVWANGKFSSINLGTEGCTDCTSINGISDNNIVVGQAFRNDFWNGFLKAGADDDFRGGKNKGSDTFANGVNNATDIVGFNFQQGYFAKHIELNEGTNDSTEVVPGFIKVLFPNSAFTIPFGLNSVRAVVGTYGKNDGTGLHGFVATANF